MQGGEKFFDKVSWPPDVDVVADTDDDAVDALTRHAKPRNHNPLKNFRRNSKKTFFLLHRPKNEMKRLKTRRKRPFILYTLLLSNSRKFSNNKILGWPKISCNENSPMKRLRFQNGIGTIVILRLIQSWWNQVKLLFSWHQIEPSNFTLWCSVYILAICSFVYHKED